MRLAETWEFKRWVDREVSIRLSDVPIEKRVDEMMAPENLVIEYLGNKPLT